MKRMKKEKKSLNNLQRAKKYVYEGDESHVNFGLEKIHANNGESDLEL
jgi:hypothetical protein